MNYIDRIATTIYRISEGEEPEAWKDDAPLYRIYAVLALTKGAATTSEDVHDAWSAWRSGIDPTHRSIVPFIELEPHVQAYDDKYRDAIHAVARKTNERTIAL